MRGGRLLVLFASTHAEAGIPFPQGRRQASGGSAGRAQGPVQALGLQVALRRQEGGPAAAEQGRARRAGDGRHRRPDGVLAPERVGPPGQPAEPPPGGRPDGPQGRAAAGPGRVLRARAGGGAAHGPRGAEAEGGGRADGARAGDADRGGQAAQADAGRAPAPRVAVRRALRPRRRARQEMVPRSELVAAEARHRKLEASSKRDAEQHQAACDALTQRLKAAADEGGALRAEMQVLRSAARRPPDGRKACVAARRSP